MPGALLAQQDGDLPLGEEDEEELTPVQEYDQIWRQIDALVIYNHLLERQIVNQERRIEQINASMEGVPELERQLPAVLARMVDALEQFVELDIPLHREERTERVAELRAMLERGGSDVEKFRRIIEAWQVENEYGRTRSVYTGELEINGTLREVDFLQVGRVAFVYQTFDQEYTGVWDQQNRSWVPLGPRYRNSVRQAIRIGRDQIAPELVLLPVPVPTEN
jgi:hypothetical protein